VGLLLLHDIQELLADGMSSLANVPWYGYAGGAGLCLVAARALGVAATKALNELEVDGADKVDFP
jgi:hypothetical protein